MAMIIGAAGFISVITLVFLSSGIKVAAKADRLTDAILSGEEIADGNQSKKKQNKEAG